MPTAFVWDIFDWRRGLELKFTIDHDLDCTSEHPARRFWILDQCASEEFCEKLIEIGFVQTLPDDLAFGMPALLKQLKRHPEDCLIFQWDGEKTTFAQVLDKEDEIFRINPRATESEVAHFDKIYAKQVLATINGPFPDAVPLKRSANRGWRRARKSRRAPASPTPPQSA